MAVGSSAEEIDTEMKQANKAAEGLAESKHALKQTTEEEIDRIAREIDLEEEKTEEEYKVIEEDKAEGRSDLFNAPQDLRNARELFKSIVKNNKVVEEFKALPNKKKWWKPAKAANLAKRLILTAGDVIEGRY